MSQKVRLWESRKNVFTAKRRGCSWTLSALRYTTEKWGCIVLLDQETSAKLNQVNLFKHQQEAVKFAIDRQGRCAFFLDVGTGKTLTALATFMALRRFNPRLRLLVVCPLSLIESAWIEDAARFTDLKCVNMRESNKWSDVDVFICNYEYLLKAKNQEIICGMAAGLQFMCVIDESSRIKNHKAKTTKALLRMRDYFKHRIVMSATPAPNDESEYWPQMKFVNDGVFHNSFYAFRNKYFHYARNGEVVPRGVTITKDVARNLFSKGFKLTIDSSKRDELLGRVAQVAFQARKEDCLDLPDQVDETRFVTLSPAQRKAYKQMRSAAIAEIKEGQFAVAQVALTKIMKLRQITSGFALVDGGAAQDIEGPNPKMDELKSVLEEIGKKQVIIWGVFRHEIERIAALLGENAVTLYGADSESDKNANIKAFKEGRAQYLVANPHTAGHGLTFTNCAYQVFYSLDYSWERYYQAKGRTHRAGQTQKCTYIHILARKTIDEIILRVLNRKGNEQELLKEAMA